MPILKNFCCCIALPTGALIIGALETILGFIWIIKSIIRWYNTEGDLEVLTKKMNDVDVSNEVFEELVICKFFL
jgi:hypothetical protein